MSNKEDDKVYRNPARKLADSERHKTYTPEYKRLGREPILLEIKEQPPTSPKQKRPTQIPPQLQQHQKPPIPPKIAAQATMVDVGSDVPEPTPRVYSGRNHNWYDMLEEEQRASTEDILLDEINVPSLEEEKEEFTDDEISSIKHDEAEWEKAMEEDKKSVEDDVAPSDLTDVEPGFYCLLVRDEVVAISSTKDELEKKIEQIVFGEDESFEDVTVNDIMIFKRIPIKAGILLVE